MKSSSRSRFPRTRLQFEQLEDRTTPSASAVTSITSGSTAAATLNRVNVVMTTPTESAADAAALAAAPFATEVEYIGFGIYRVSLADGVSAADAATYYSAQVGVVLASPDTHIQVQQTPNDTSYSSLYGLSKIGAPTAWDTTTGSSKFVVGVIDTGVDYTHPDLALNIAINQSEIPTAIRATLTDTNSDGLITFRDLNASANAGKVTDANGNGYIDGGDILRTTAQGGWSDGVDNDGNGFTDDFVGWDFVNNDNNPMDDNAHGTHVSGTIGAVGNNSLGVVGVNWSVQIMGLKFLDSNGSGYTSDAIAALNYAVARGVKLSNNSWGGGPSDSALAAAIGQAKNAGHIFVAAAGNSGLNIDTTLSYPGSYSTSYNNVVTVAATGSTDTLASFSNYGVNSVTLAAPGVGILSTTPGNTYSSFSGTSMAAPHVAGAIALYWSANPTLTYSQVIAKLKSSVDTISGLSGKVQTAGRLNVAKMLEVTSPPVTGDVGPAVLAAAFSGSTSSRFNRVRFTFDRAITPSTFTAADIASFTGPTGAAIGTNYTITAVAGSGNKQFDVTFNTQSAPGAYKMTIGPDILDTSNNKMNQDGDGVVGEATQDRFTATGSLVTTVTRNPFAAGLPKAINDFQTTTSTITITEAINITDLNVKVSLTHTYVGDLTIRLKSPTGQYVTLFANRGGSGDNLSNTIFNDEATRAISAGIAPFLGSFRPEQLLSAYDNKSAQGTWTLEVTDSFAQDTGTLTAWSMGLVGTLGSVGGQQVKALGFRDALEAVSAPIVVGNVRAPVAGAITTPVAAFLAPAGVTIPTYNRPDEQPRPFEGSSSRTTEVSANRGESDTRASYMAFLESANGGIWLHLDPDFDLATPLEA